VGRDESCDVVISDAGVSSRHARISASVHGHLIEDLVSTNGTFVNGQPVARAALMSGDTIELGRSGMRYERIDDN
jgi:pSer/pThr/pTyr-binding forkhead associated (FHA) protein